VGEGYLGTVPLQYSYPKKIAQVLDAGATGTFLWREKFMAWERNTKDGREKKTTIGGKTQLLSAGKTQLLSA
jgi:hypothetical protein